MDFYYRKSMGNGTMASKFRLNHNRKGDDISNSGSPKEERKQKSDGPIPKETEETSSDSKNPGQSETYSEGGPNIPHRNNCNRCYRLKKKCSRSIPKCDNCEKSGSDCTYVDRQSKKRKRTESKKDDEGATVSPMPAGSSAEILQIVDQTDNQSQEFTESEQLVAQKLVSISSLLSAESGDTSRGREPKRMHLPLRSRSFQRRDSGESSSKGTYNKIMLKSLSAQNQSNLREEFITIQAVEKEDLPMTWVLTFFQNFENKYPFIDKRKFMASFKKLDFKTETIVGLDIYLLMVIGAIIYDRVNKTDVFHSYFNKDIITSMIDVLNFQPDINSEEDIEHIKILLLLGIYGQVAMNNKLCWGVLGILDRLVVDSDMFKSKFCNSESMKRLFWSIYAMDKESSLLRKKFSQLPILDIVEVSVVLNEKLFDTENLNVINSGIQLMVLQDSILDLRLRKNVASEALTALSGRIEKWRIQASSSIHIDYAQSPYLQVYVSRVNIHYYYMLIELDQVSSSESFQFTLHFLSNSFTLLMTDNSKTGVEVCINDLFWYRMLFNVIEYNLTSLVEMVRTPSTDKTNFSLKFGEFNGNLQLIINLLKFVDKLAAKTTLAASVTSAIDHLSDLSVRLINFNITTTSSKESTDLSSHVAKLKSCIRLT